MSVSYAVVDGVAWLTIERPEARNALSAAVRAGLWDGVHRFNDDESAGVLVVTGAGDKAFCAGGDLKEMASSSLEVPPPEFLPLFGRNVEVPKPTIAAVNGVAFAGGFALAQHCDLCIAAERAHQIGLVNEVVPLADLRDRVQAVALTILANAPLSVRAAKRTIELAAPPVPWDEIDALWEPVYRSADAQEGPAAFGEGRMPRWRGR